MKKSFKYISLIFCVLFLKDAVAQDPIFSQIQNTPSIFNPSLTAVGVQKGVVRFKYRDANWGKHAVLNSVAFLNIEQKFQTQSEYDYVAIGGSLLTEKVGGGLFVQNLATISGAYYNSFNEDGSNGLSVGLGVTYGNKMLDMSLVKTQDMFGSFGFPSATSADPAAVNFKMNYVYFNAGVGYNIQFSENDLFHIGAAMFKVNRPKEARNVNSKMDSRIVIESKYKKYINNDESLELIANHQQIAKASITTIGAMYSKLIVDDEHLVELGLLHRINYALIPYFGLGIRKAKFGLSYDVTLAKQKNLLNALPTIELTLAWSLN